MVVLLRLNLPLLNTSRGIGIDPLEGHTLLLEVFLDLDAIGAPLGSNDLVAHL